MKTSPVSAAHSTRRPVALLFVSVFLALGFVFALTASWTQPYHGDAFTNAVTGWYLGNEGTVIAAEHSNLANPDQRGNFSWFVESPRGPVGQYPPGTALVAGAFYLLTPGDMEVRMVAGNNRPDLEALPVGVPPLWPATLSAVVTTAAACAVLALVYGRLGGTWWGAFSAGLASGLATGAWSVSSNMSWTHGPAMLCVALGALACSRERWLWGGLALGAGILVRPHLAVVAAMVGIFVGFTRRSWRVVAEVGAGSGLGLAGLLLYNYWLWGTFSISGSYGDGFSERFATASWGWFIENVAGALFDPLRGVVIWAPFLIVLAWGAVSSREIAPDWTKGLALGGAAYLLLQLRANRFSGGEGHFSYRYPLEAMTAAAPWLYVGYLRWVKDRRLMRLATWAVLAVSGGAQAFGAIIS